MAEETKEIMDKEQVAKEDVTSKATDANAEIADNKENTSKEETVEESTEEKEVVEEVVEEPSKEEATEEATEELSDDEDLEESDEDSKDESADAKGLTEPTVTKEEFAQLRKEVKSIGGRKEWLFEVRSIVSKEIKSLFSNLKDLKESRDELTSQVKSLKDEREQINSDIKGAISKIKGVKPADGDYKRVNVGKLKKELERLQYHIETVPMSPEEEKKVMRQIKEKEKIISKSEVVVAATGENKEVSKEINALKERSNEIHDKVQDSAKDSQIKHETMIAVSKEIKFLKAREKEIHQQFAEIKELYKQKRRLLMQNRKFFAPAKKKTVKTGGSQKDMIQKVEANVEEKMKKGLKITTEDLMAFRG